MDPLLHLLLASLLQLSAAAPSCSPKPCGGLSIALPFWLDEPGRPPCGVPSFQVSCNTSGAFLARSVFGSYQILDIFYRNSSFLVADRNLPRDRDCPAPPFNISDGLRLAPFTVSRANRELVFLHNCTAPPPPGFRRLRCSSDSSLARLGDGGGGHDPVGEVPPGCEVTVVPVLGSEGRGADVEYYLGHMRDGFLLEWPGAGDCGACTASGGACGYGTDECLCPDGIRARTCGRKDLKKRIGIGFGAGAGALVMLGFGFMFYLRKKRKQLKASQQFMRSASSMHSYGKDPELGGSHQIFTYEELAEATDGFSASRELGDGGFGTVYKGKLRDGRVVAVKRLYKNTYKRVEQFLNEVDILSRLLHQNLVILYGCTSRSSRELLLVYEFIPNGTVADHLHGSRAGERGLTWPIRMNIAIETADALAYLHAVEIIHRDVKTNNILLDNGFHVKVADFGLSRLFPLDVTHVSTVPQGTPGYVDPVYHQCYKLTDKSDVYSFGVVLVELISSKPAVDMNRSHSEINLATMALHKIQNYEIDQLVDPELGYQTDGETKRMIDLVAELAFRCLQLDRDLRPPIKEVVDALNGIKNGECKAKQIGKDASMKEDAQLLQKSMQYSPDTVIHRWHSQSTNQSTASNASG